MKNGFTITQRNAVVEQHLWCIDTVMAQYAAFMQTEPVDPDDVYQSLAVRLIRAVNSYDPCKGYLKEYILSQLKREMVRVRSTQAVYGLTQARPISAAPLFHSRLLHSGNRTGKPILLYKRRFVEMKQLGNLAVICAQRPELLMQLRGGLVLVQAKNRAAMEAAWNDDARIEKMIYELNFGAFSKERLV